MTLTPKLKMLGQLVGSLEWICERLIETVMRAPLTNLTPTGALDWPVFAIAVLPGTEPGAVEVVVNKSGRVTALRVARIFRVLGEIARQDVLFGGSEVPKVPFPADELRPILERWLVANGEDPRRVDGTAPATVISPSSNTIN